MQTPNPPARAPILVSIWAALIALPFGWSRDFGVLLVGLFYGGPALVSVCAAILAWTVFQNDIRRQAIGLQCVLAIVLTVPLTLVSVSLTRDRLAFALWYPTHLDKVAWAARHEGVVETWDNWGMAGSENDAYLVSSPQRDLGTVQAASTWSAGLPSGCPVVAVQRMTQTLYLMTSYNCPLQ